MPLHPAVVHLPLGIAFLMPFLVLTALVVAWREGPSRRLLAPLVLSQAILLVGAIVAKEQGEEDEEIVEHRVEAAGAERALEDHEDLANQFTAASGAVLVVLAAALVAPLPARRWTLLAGGAGTLLVTGLGLATGHAGGELVYVHNAAAPHVELAASGANLAPGEAASRGERDDDDDDDDD